MYLFDAAHQTSFAKLPAFFQKFTKAVHTLRVNKTKSTPRNAFIANVYELKSENKSNKDKQAHDICLHFFKKFQKECALSGLMKVKLLPETLLLTMFMN